MKIKLFIHNPLFRLLVPPIYGIMVYLFILTLFDSLYQITENFFSYEALLIIIMTYFLMEGLRIIILLLNKYLPEDRKESMRIITQLVASIIYGAFITSAIVAFYFFILVGYSSFLTEFLTFNIIFVLSALLYTMVYYSVYYLNQQNVVMLSKENTIRESLEYELESFKNEINPSFLYESLESLISLIHKDPIPAEKFISQLSGIYRYKLESKRNELVDIKDEIRATINLISVLNVKFENNIQLDVNDLTGVERKKMVPGTLQDFTEYAVKSSIISATQPLVFSIDSTPAGSVVFSYRKNDRLAPDHAEDIHNMNVIRAYEFYSNQQVKVNKNKERLEIEIPLLELMEEEI